MYDGSPNAFIARSRDGWYAILFSSGFAVFVHKYIKLMTALTHPGSITYCNRKTATQIERSDLIQYIDEMVQYYIEHRIPRGPMVKLTREGSSRASTILKLAETFVHCHELGHFINGYLSDDSAYVVLPSGIPGEKYNEDLNHEIEHKADITGYRIYLGALRQRGVQTHSRQAVLAPVVLLFDLLFKLGSNNSQTHPHPYDRVVKIVGDYVGADDASLATEALRNPTAENLNRAFPIGG